MLTKKEVRGLWVLSLLAIQGCETIEAPFVEMARFNQRVLQKAGATSNPLLDAAGIPNKVPPSPSSPESSLEENTKEIVSCRSFAIANWILERPTLEKAYKEAELVATGGHPSMDLERAVDQACATRPGTEKGDAIVWRCNNPENECVRKQRLAGELRTIITELSSPLEMSGRLAVFIKEERERLLSEKTR